MSTKISTQIVHNGLDVIVSSCDSCLYDEPVGIADSIFYTRNIISDFGPRVLYGDYNFHGGVDYTAEEVNDRGYGVYPVEEGTVRRLRVGAGQKYVEVTGGQAILMYNHLFDINEGGGNFEVDDGDIKLVELDGFPDPSNEFRYGILSYRNGDTTLVVNCLNSCLFSYKIIASDTLFGTNQVNTNTIIGSLGVSAGSSNPYRVASHLHIQRFINPEDYNKNNLVDPLEILRHQGPNYEATFHHKGNNIQSPGTGVVISYPGDVESEIMVRTVMPDSLDGSANNGFGANWIFDSNTMNVDRVELLYNLNGEDILLRGNNLDAKIWMGARMNESDHYPINGDHIRQGWFSNTVGVVSRQGIRPIAYSSRNGRWDDYYFTDILTRVNKNNFNNGEDLEPTSCPANALISDGPNNLIARITSVRDIESKIESPEFYVDNFKPFIKSVVASIGNKEVYAFEWTCADNGECEGITSSGGFQTFEVIDNNDIAGGFTVSVTTSEPLQDLTLTLGNYCMGTDCPDIIQQGTSSDETIWSFQFDGIPDYFSADSTDNSSEIWSMKFEGHDYDPNGNQGQQLLNLSGFFNPGDDENDECVSLPHRTSLNSWSSNTIPQGEETAHYFQFSCGQGLVTDNAIRINCCELEITGGFIRPYELSACDANDGSIQIFNINYIGNDGNVTRHWERNGVVMEGVNGHLSNLSIGTYCYVLTDESGCRADTCFVIGYQDGIHSTIQTSTVPACDDTGTTGSITYSFYPYYDEPPFHVLECSNGDILTEPNGVFQDEYVFTGLLPATYTITITDPAVPNCPLIEEITVGIDDNPVDQLVVSNTRIDHPCPGNNNGVASITVSGGRGPYTFDWGDLVYTQIFNTGSIGNLGEGQACVIVTDGCGYSLSECFELRSMEVIATGGGGCGFGTASLDIQNGSTPYSIQWSNGSSSPTINNLEFGEYSATVTDANGCEIVTSPISVANTNVTVQNVVRTCTGFEDGSFNLIIDNPLQEEIFMTSNGGPIPFTTSLDPVVIQPFIGLPASTIELEVSIGACSFNRTIVIEDIPLQLEYVETREDENGIEFCVFDQLCQGEVVGEANSFAASGWELPGNPADHDCELQRLCGDKIIDTQESDNITLPLGAYLFLIDNAPFDAEYIDLLLSEVAGHPNLEIGMGSNNTLCAKIKFCPYTLRISAVFTCGDKTTSTNVSAGSNGCLEVECRGANCADDYNVCNEVLDPIYDPIFGGGATFEPNLPPSCEIKSLPIFQLIQWHDEMQANFNNYGTGTGLFDFIDLLINNGSQSDFERAICAHATYCVGTWELLDENLDEVDCSETVIQNSTSNGVNLIETISSCTNNNSTDPNVNVLTCVINGVVSTSSYPIVFDPDFVTLSPIPVPQPQIEGQFTRFAVDSTSKLTLNHNAKQYDIGTYEIQVYPNPSKGIYQLSSPFEIKQVHIFNSQGVLINTLSGKSISLIDLTRQVSGSYYVKISTENLSEIIRLIKL